MKIACSYTRLVAIDEIRPHPSNRNTHPDKQIKTLAKIIAKVGMRSPLVVSNLSGYLVKGHGRLAALQLLGVKEVPVDFQDYENELEELNDRIADNEIARYAEFDQSGFLEDLKAFELTDIDFEEFGLIDFELPKVEVIPQCDEDDVPEPPKEPKTVKGDLYEFGEHRLLCGDSTMIDDVEKLMNGQKADMVFTDPPYGIGFNYNSHKDESGEEYINFCKEWFSNLKTLSDFIVISTGWAYNLFWYQNQPKDTFYWICKNKRTGGSLSHFRKVEPIFLWGKPANKYDFDFFEQTTQIEEELKGKHTCPKPVSLVESIIAGGENKGSVLDVFCGSGTSVIACEKTNRKCYGMEIDEHYCDVIVSRWCKYTGKNKIKLNGQEIIWEVDNGTSN